MFGKSKSGELFFAAFGRHAETIVEAGKGLVELFAEPGRAVELAQRIKDTEHAADDITHETISRLHKQWITPFDRADIHSLVTSLDDVVDAIDEVATHVVIFRIESVPDAAKQCTEVIHQSGLAIRKAVTQLGDLSHPEKILQLCVEINALENQADELYRAGMGQLFEPGADALVVMKWRDIYTRLEAATDRCEDVANVLEGIVLEYS